MNKLLLFFLFALLFASCSQTVTEQPAKVADDSLAMSIALNEPAANKDTANSVEKDTEEVMSLTAVPVEDISVKGKAFYNLSYCSGAAPPEEVLKELAKPRALKNTKIVFMLLPGRTQREVARTDENGNFTVALDKGKWEYYLTEETDPKLGLNPKCGGWFSGSYGSVTSSGGGKAGLEVLFHLGCDPCDPTIKMRP